MPPFPLSPEIRNAILTYAGIAAGSAIGGVARYWCYGLTLRMPGPLFPWGTLAVNVMGSFVISFFATLTGADGRALVSPPVRIFVMVGLCGGFTTFSTFSLETLYLLRDGQWIKATANILLSLFLCLAGAWGGHVIATAVNER